MATMMHPFLKSQNEQQQYEGSFCIKNIKTPDTIKSKMLK